MLNKDLMYNVNLRRFLYLNVMVDQNSLSNNWIYDENKIYTPAIKNKSPTSICCLSSFGRFHDG